LTTHKWRHLVSTSGNGTYTRRWFSAPERPDGAGRIGLVHKAVFVQVGAPCLNGMRQTSPI
jgi:hypothetical protein